MKATRSILHGAKASRLLDHARQGESLCITVTLVDGIVAARSAFHSSMNYRSAVLFGCGRLVEDPAAKLHALEVLTEHVLPGRWAEVRPTTAKELNATSVVAVTIESASAKTRSGPPSDDEEDYALPIWAGVLPLRQEFLPPVPDPKLEEQTAAACLGAEYTPRARPKQRAEVGRLRSCGRSISSDPEKQLAYLVDMLDNRRHCGSCDWMATKVTYGTPDASHEAAHSLASIAAGPSSPPARRRLNEGPPRPPGVTLVAAPAGFGKTTLVGEWVVGKPATDRLAVTGRRG